MASAKASDDVLIYEPCAGGCPLELGTKYVHEARKDRLIQFVGRDVSLMAGLWCSD